MSTADAHMIHNTEARILTALLEKLRAAGYEPASVWTEECYVVPTINPNDTVEASSGDAAMTIPRAMTHDEVRAVLNDYDLYAPTIHFCTGSLSWGSWGVMVVPGNGNDFISDWHCGDEAFNTPVDEVATAASDGAYS